jgi:transcriptional regulator with XRE-family HTH domain
VESFAELIKRKRLEKGLTMRGLEDELRKGGAENISRSLINLMEKNLRRPSYEVAYNLAKVLNIDTKEALRAAYRARADHDRKREETYLRDFIEGNSITGLDVFEL